MAAFVHIHRAEAEAEDVKFACLTRALTIALAINHLFIMTTLSDCFLTWFQTRSIMINQSIRAYGSAHITFSHSEAWWAGWIPLFITLLTVSALLRLAIATPERERLLTALRSLFEEFGAGEILFIFFVTSYQIVIFFIIHNFERRLIISHIFMLRSAASAFLASLSPASTSALLWGTSLLTSLSAARSATSTTSLKRLLFFLFILFKIKRLLLLCR